jgi:P4 family phage/plasmid primase-like protien
LHAYWLLNSFTTDLDAIKSRNLGLIVALNNGKSDGIADSCFDLARILRLPGTYNVKRDPPLLCSIVEYNPDRICQITDFTPAEYRETAVDVWDSVPLSGDFIETLKERDPKLVKRILNEVTARKIDAPMKADGSIDRSRNDAYIATRLLGLGYAPETILSVLMHDEWLSGARYAERKRYDYVVMTVNSALRVFKASEDRYFVKTAFQTDRLAQELNTSNRFIFVAERLYRYENGVFLEDGAQFIKAQAVKRLGKRWSSRASDETLRYVIDQSHIPQETVNQITEYANCVNGMLHLTTRELKPHSPAYLSLSQIPVLWEPSIDCSTIDQFISEVLQNDAIDTFWEFVGSAFITARYEPKHFMVLWGPGDSGKSKVIELLGRFFGRHNTQAIAFQTLMDNRFATAALYGKMVNLFSDLSQSEANNCDYIKTLTGDDVISAERKFKEPFQFKCTTRSIFSSNHFPKVKSADEQYFKRALIIACPNHFGSDRADPGIVDRLATPANFSAMLLRAVEGFERLRKNNGLTRSPSINAASNEYRFTADTVAGFWHACPFDADAVVSKQEAYAIYRQVCQAANRKEVSDDLFYKRTAEQSDRFGIRASYDMIKPASRDEDQVRQWRYHGRQMPQTATLTYTLNLNGRSN